MSYYCTFMKYQMMVDLKQKGKSRYAPCCHFEEDLELKDFQNKTADYLDRLVNGEKLDQCKHCWSREDVGLPSVRTGDLVWKPSDGQDGIRMLDIRIHNKCNLACTMCYSGASNLWGKLEGKDTFHKISDYELDFLKKSASNVEKISFQGGEPFYGNEYDEFLMALDNKKNISVDVFTNLISAKPSVIQRWNDELKQLYINASVDGYGEVYDSIRWPTTWGKWEKSAKAIYKIVDFRMTYFWVIQAENVYNLFDFIKWRDENTPKSRIMLSTLSGGSDLLGLESISQEDKDMFFSNYEMYSKNEYDINWFGPEIETIEKIKNIVKDIEPNETKIIEKNNRIRDIKLLREKYIQS